MEESDRSLNPELLPIPATNEEHVRSRVEHLFELLKKEGMTSKEVLYLSAFLISFFGLTFNIKFYRGIAKAMFDSITDIEKQNIDILNHPIASIEDGLSSRSDINKQG